MGKGSGMVIEHITYDDLDEVWADDEEKYPKDSVIAQEIEQEKWNEIRRLNQEICGEVHKGLRR